VEFLCCLYSPIFYIFSVCFSKSLHIYSLMPALYIFESPAIRKANPMPVTLNTPRLSQPSVVHEHGTPEYLREHYLQVASNALFAEFKNATTVRYMMAALIKWETVPGTTTKGFENFVAARRKINAQLDRNGGEIRGLLEHGVKAIVGEDQPQPRLDEASEMLADRLNFIAQSIDEECSALEWEKTWTAGPVCPLGDAEDRADTASTFAACERLQRPPGRILVPMSFPICLLVR
jgi:hypothetical protein